MNRRHAFTMLWVIAPIASAAAIGAGCGSDNFGNPSTLVDTTGESFVWTCRSDGCDAEPEGDLVVTCEGDPNDGFMYRYARFVELCPAYPSGALTTTYDALCRLVACEGSDECPQFAAARYACENSLCQRADPDDDALYARDVLALCLGDAPRVSDCAELGADADVASAYSLVLAECGSDLSAVCASVPDGCRSP